MGKYNRKLLELAEVSVSGVGDGRISKDDAAKLLDALKDINTYSDIEKATMAYISVYPGQL